MATSIRAVNAQSTSTDEVATIEQPNTEVGRVENPQQELGLTSRQVNQLQMLIDSNQLPNHIKSVATIFTIMKMGRELGFPTMQALHYIIPIQGKLTLSAKALGAILRKAKVTMQTKEEAVWVYRDNSTSVYRKSPEEEAPVDRRTSILFTRDGLEELVSFTITDATLQGLTTKDNWKRMPKEMLWARCLSKGANRIGQDLLLGLYSTDEMFDSLDTSGLSATRSEDGTIESVVETLHEEVFN